MDEVDRIVAAWRHERPDLDVSPMEVLSRVSRLSKQLDKARKVTFHNHGLEVWAFDVLSALRRSGAPYQLSPSRLIGEMMVTSGTMTNRIDRMVTHGLVVRSPDPSDRRVVHVQITALGIEKVDAAISDLVADEAVLLEAVGGEGAQDLGELLKALLVPLEAGASD